MLLSFNVNAGQSVNFNDFAPKNELFEHKNNKEIQKFLNTKLGKWVIKKIIKKIKKKQLKSDIKNRSSKNSEIFNHTMKILIFSAVLFLVGIGLLIGGYTTVGIILGALGLLIGVGVLLLILSIGRAFSR